jgi:hypothetical protein
MFTDRELRIQLDRAIDDGDLARAWRVAGRIDRVGLDQALGVVVMLGRRKDPRFERAALRWVERFCAERAPGLPAVSKVCDALGTVRSVGDLPAMSDAAFKALEDLRRRLRPN